MSATLMTKAFNINLMYFAGTTMSWQIQSTRIEFSCQADVPAGGDQELLQKNFNKSFARISAMNEAIINESMVVSNEDYTEHFELLDKITNNIIILPVLSESVLAAALFIKFNMLCMQYTKVTSVTVEDLTSNIKHTHTGEEVNVDIMPQNYNLGDYPVWTAPWWTRIDSYTYEANGNSEEEVKELQKIIANTPDPIIAEVDIQLDQIYNIKSEETSDINEEDGEVIKVDFGKKPDKTLH